MKATTLRPKGTLVAIRQASLETGLPEAVLRDLIKRRKLAVFKPDDIRRVFIRRDSLEAMIAEGGRS